MNNPTAPPLQSIYPILEGPQEVLVAIEQYRLQHISRLQWQLEEERDLRAALYKKYHRGVNVLDGIDTTLITVSMGLGVGVWGSSQPSSLLQSYWVWKPDLWPAAYLR